VWPRRRLQCHESCGSQFPSHMPSGGRCSGWCAHEWTPEGHLQAIAAEVAEGFPQAPAGGSPRWTGSAICVVDFSCQGSK
jgi:hypothetical protein